MKFAFEEFHLWYQVALSMVACGKVRPRDRVAGEGGGIPAFGASALLQSPPGLGRGLLGESEMFSSIGFSPLGE